MQVWSSEGRVNDYLDRSLWLARLDSPKPDGLGHPTTACFSEPISYSWAGSLRMSCTINVHRGQGQRREIQSMNGTLRQDFLNGCQDVCIVYIVMAPQRRCAPVQCRLERRKRLHMRVNGRQRHWRRLEPLKDTCTCSYGKFHGMFDIFKMPSSGDCKDTSKAELFNNSTMIVSIYHRDCISRFERS